MPVVLRIAAIMLLTVVALAGTAAAETLAHGRFRHVQIYKPAGEVRSVVLFLSGEDGWNEKLAEMATSLVADGALVAGIDTRDLFANLEKSRGKCAYVDGDLENLSHYIQAYYKLPAYYTPTLIGYSAGATLAYAMIVQAPTGTFTGAISLSFCPDLDLRKPLCKGEGLDSTAREHGRRVRLAPAAEVRVPWVVLHERAGATCQAADVREFIAHTKDATFVELPDGLARASGWLPQFKTAYESIATAHSHSLPPPPARLGDLPVVEVPAADTGQSDLFAVLLSGDGGWAGLDREVARTLAGRGIPVAGLDSLRYFWRAKTPDALAQDLDRMLAYYAARWHKRRALLIGYSQGADVLPFAVNRLPPASRALVALTTLIGIGQTASFEFYVSHWLGHANDGLPVAPELAKLSSSNTLCLYGDDDKETICPAVNPANVRGVELHGGHHFGGDYEGLAKLILDHARQLTPQR
jgi:type IV secretory pathway VirJ component